MGTPGEIEVLEYEEKLYWYSLNMIFDGITRKDLSDNLEFFKNVNVGFGGASGYDEKYEYIDLGFGNHLFVHKDVYQYFDKEYLEKRPSEKYATWKDYIEEILKDKFDEKFNN